VKDANHKLQRHLRIENDLKHRLKTAQDAVMKRELKRKRTRRARKSGSSSR